jgi:mRNA interferase MazF
MDKLRPALVLTRETVRPHLNQVTVAPITSTARGLSTEVAVGPRNGLDRDSIVNCDLITTIPSEHLGSPVGFLLESQERALAAAIRAAFLLLD